MTCDKMLSFPTYTLGGVEQTSIDEWSTQLTHKMIRLKHATFVWKTKHWFLTALYATLSAICAMPVPDQNLGQNLLYYARLKNHMHIYTSNEPPGGNFSYSPSYEFSRKIPKPPWYSFLRLAFFGCLLWHLLGAALLVLSPSDVPALKARIAPTVSFILKLPWVTNWR